jgi:hypothetical protein
VKTIVPQPVSGAAENPWPSFSACSIIAFEGLKAIREVSIKRGFSLMRSRIGGISA